jgi:hypothetical protein
MAYTMSGNTFNKPSGGGPGVSNGKSDLPPNVNVNGMVRNPSLNGPNQQQANAGSGYEALSRALSSLSSSQRPTVQASYPAQSSQNMQRPAQSSVPVGSTWPRDNSNNAQFSSYSPFNSDKNWNSFGSSGATQSGGNRQTAPQQNNALAKYQGMNSGMGNWAKNDYFANNAPTPVNDYPGDNLPNQNADNGGDFYSGGGMNDVHDPVNDYAARKGFDVAQKFSGVANRALPVFQGIDKLAGLLGATNNGQNTMGGMGGGGNGLLAPAKPKKNAKAAKRPAPVGKPGKKGPLTAATNFVQWQFPEYSLLSPSELPKPYPV